MCYPFSLITRYRDINNFSLVQMFNINYSFDSFNVEFTSKMNINKLQNCYNNIIFFFFYEF